MDFKLPKSAFVEKFIPKNTFFKKTSFSSKMKQEMTDKIQKIIWKYKLAENTIGVQKTKNIEEIEIFEIQLKEYIIPKNILKIIDSLIPYPILYVFYHEENTAFGITLKGENNGNYYFSEWNENIEFDFYGMNLEKVYENIIKKFIKTIDTKAKDFVEIIEIDSKIVTLQKEIEALKNKIQKEKQFNRKSELNKILLEKKKQLEKLEKKNP